MSEKPQLVRFSSKKFQEGLRVSVFLTTAFSTFRLQGDTSPSVASPIALHLGLFPRSVILKLQPASSSPGGLVRVEITGHIPRVLDSVVLG